MDRLKREMEMVKLMAEVSKLSAETAKLNKEIKWYEITVIVAATLAIATIAKLIL